jgi:predicted unusual protein kinase regulating ubiquinone biosynthesis (AarF/ABC1/UbiB family)
VTATRAANQCPEPELFALRPPSTLEFADRAAQVAAVVARRLGPAIARRASGREVTRAQIARPLRRAFEDLGGTFMKYGQVIASSASLFGEEMAAEFRSCLDTGPVVRFDRVRAQIERAVGGPVETVFARLEREPIGQASLAVVHRGTLHDGREVAVKVLRPGIESRVATDLALMRIVFNQLGGQLGPKAVGPLSELLDGLRGQLCEELNLGNEARVMQYFRRLPERSRLPLIAVPEPHLELSDRRVLVMEFLDGVPVDDLTRVEELGYDPAPLVEQVVQSWFMTALRGGVFHGDVHAGNIMLLRDGRLGVIDWGIVGRLTPETHDMFRNLVAGALGDDEAWNVVAKHFVAQWGPIAQQRLGVDDAWIASLFRDQVGQVLTRPFGEISLSELLMAPQKEIARKRAEKRAADGHGPAPSNRRQRMRAMRREGGDAELPPIDRGMMLLGKQLAYFERYGRLYMRDISLLHDAEFFSAVLAAGPLDDA